MLTSAQIRMARHALRWSVSELAETTGLSISTIKRIEASDGEPNSTKANLATLQTALEAAGIEFIGTSDDAPGVRIRTSPPKP
jgi:transcriptional regulator with XRE-family HTH domain